MTAKLYLRYSPAFAVVAAASMVVAAALYIVNVMSDKPPPRVRVQQISLLPPPPPPQIEKPPEIKKEVPTIDAPKNVPPAVGDPNATKNTAGNGPDTGYGDPTAGIGEPFGNYSADLKADIRDWFSRDKKLSRQNYEVILKVWIADSGRIARVELANPTGNGELDQRLRLMVAGLVGKVREPPPQEMPQPVRLGVRSQL